MTLALKARQNRFNALRTVEARHANVFAETFGQYRRARP